MQTACQFLRLPLITNVGTLDPPPAVTLRSAAVESRERQPSTYLPYATYGAVSSIRSANRTVSPSMLGKGSFGEAFLVRRKSDGQLLVAKQMDLSVMSTKDQKYVEAEIQCLASCHHFAIIGYVMINLHTTAKIMGAIWLALGASLLAYRAYAAKRSAESRAA